MVRVYIALHRMYQVTLTRGHISDTCAIVLSVWYCTICVWYNARLCVCVIDSCVWTSVC